MSALAGILNLDGSPVEATALRRMAEVVSHRGVDGTGYYVSGNIGLAELRLHSSPQDYGIPCPAPSPDGRFTIAWDGRIDNRGELIDALKDHAPVTGATPDNELALAGFQRWGERIGERLVGDYAFAVWDAQSKALTCFRDPIGFRLFHYFSDGRRFIFSTELRQLFAHPSVSKTVDELTLGLFMSGVVTFGDRTFFKDMRRLRGGYSLTVSASGLKQRLFWDPGREKEIRYKTEDDYAARLRTLFLDATRARLRSTTRVTIMLSGGIDSGSVASAAGYVRETESPGQPLIDAVFWGSANPQFDEWPYAKDISDRYGINLERRDADNYWAMKQAQNPPHLDEPVNLPLDAMHFDTYSRLRDRGCRVMMDGEGGDEAFMAGYMLYLKDWLYGLRWGRLAADLRQGTPYYRKEAVKMLRRSMFPQSLRRLTGRRWSRLPDWIQSDYAKRTRLSDRADQVYVSRYRDRNYIQARGSGLFMIGADQRLAHYQIEARHPLWDSRVVDFFARIPPTVRLQGGRDKLLIKRALKGIIPESLQNRSHHGAFGTQFQVGFRQKEAPRLARLSEHLALEREGFVDGAKFRSAFGAFLNGDDSKVSRVNWVFVAEEWFRRQWPEAASDARASTGRPSVARTPGT